MADDRRRYRVVRALEGYGVRVQESVFECWLTPGQHRELRDSLRLLIEADADRIALYTLSATDRQEAILRGKGAQLSENVKAIVV